MVVLLGEREQAPH